jgi:hypothetical protein
MAFDFENTPPPYQFYEIEKLKLPSSPELYTNIEETIENLASFKVVPHWKTNRSQQGLN